jgi:hypothetical protein
MARPVANWKDPAANPKGAAMKLAKADLGPPAWVTLDEAAEWLTERTGRAWGARDVLNAALRYPIGDNPDHASNRCTAIGVALPHGYSIERAVLNVGEGRAYLEKHACLFGARKNEQVIPIWTLPVRPVALLQTHVRQLLESGWVEVATAREWVPTVGETWEMNIVTPPFVAKLENTGIPGRCLVALAERFVSDNPAVADDQGVRLFNEARPAADLQSRVQHRAAEIAREASKENSPLSSMTKVAQKLAAEAWKHKRDGGKDPLYIGGKGAHKESWYKEKLKGWQPENRPA